MIEGYRYFGYEPAEGSDHADMARDHTRVFLDVIDGRGFAQPNPSPMFPNPPGLLRLEPHSPGLRDRIWWGAGTRATAEWTAEQGMNLMSSTCSPRTPACRSPASREITFATLKAAGHDREPRVSVSRSIFPITPTWTAPTSAARAPARTRSATSTAGSRASASRAGEPEQLIKELAEDEAIAAADSLLLTVPTQPRRLQRARPRQRPPHLAPSGWR